MFCIHCGTQLPDEAKFCSKCGKPTQDVNVSEPENEVKTKPKDKPNNENNKNSNNVSLYATSKQINNKLSSVDKNNYFKSNPKEKEALTGIIRQNEKIYAVGRATTKVDKDSVAGALLLTSDKAVFIRRSRFLPSITLNLNWDNGQNCKYNKGVFSTDLWIDGQKFDIDNNTFSSMKDVLDRKIVKSSKPKSESSILNVKRHIEIADKKDYFKVNPKEKEALAGMISEDEKIDVIVMVIDSENVSGALTFTDKRAIFVSRSALGKDATYIMEWPQEIFLRTSFLNDVLTIGSHEFNLNPQSSYLAKPVIEKYKSKFN